MIPLLLPLPIDWSGKNPNNRTKGEIHDLTPQAEMPYRIIVMEKGYFYTDDLIMMDSRGYRLTEDDYQCICVNRKIIDEVKKTACAVILITNPSVANIIHVDAQMVGGEYCVLNDAILETAANVVLTTNRKLFWKDIKDKPDAFKPNGHLHALWELYGFTPQTNSLKRITTAMDKIVAKDFDGLFKEFLIEFDLADNALDDIEARLTTHINSQTNPHGITAVQLNLNLVYNGLVATQSDAQSGSNQNKTAYTTPLRSKQVVDTNFTPILTQHVNNVNNPHQDTAAKLGTMTNLEFRLEGNKYYNRGEATTATNRIGSLDYATYYNYLRTGLPVNQIVSGTFSQANYVLSAAGEGYILQPSANGYLSWQPFQQAVDRYVKKGNKILYAGTLVLPYDNNRNNQATIMGQAIVSWLTSVLGVGYPQDTIAVYRVSKNWGIGASNGTVITTLTTDAMAVLRGGRWSIPGYV